MKRRLRVLLAVGLLIPVLALSGCLFNIFQTAKTIGEGNLALLVGSGLLVPGAQTVTPQARLEFGVTDTVDFGLQTGGMFSFDGSLAAWLGANADLKVSLFSEPESLALSLGLGAGYDNVRSSWAAFLSLYLDSNVISLPLYASYRPSVILRAPEEGAPIEILNQFAIGIALAVSEKVRLLLEFDFGAAGFNSIGIGFEMLL